LSKIVDDNKTLPQALLPLRAAYKKLKAKRKWKVPTIHKWKS